MPNLKYFNLNCCCKDINNNFYNKFIKKLLSKKLYDIYLVIRISNKNIYEFYTEEELKEMFSDLDFNFNYLYKIGKIL